MTKISWGKVFIRAAGIGAGFAVTLIISFAIWSYITSQPKIPYDYCLPNDNEAAFIQIPGTKGLTKDHDITWDKGTCVPTGQKVAVFFRLNYNYSEYSFPKSDINNLEKFSKFMSRRLSEIDGFVILDNQNRYQINFPKGWEDKQNEKTKHNK